MRNWWWPNIGFYPTFAAGTEDNQRTVSQHSWSQRLDHEAAVITAGIKYLVLNECLIKTNPQICHVKLLSTVFRRFSQAYAEHFPYPLGRPSSSPRDANSCSASPPLTQPAGSLLLSSFRITVSKQTTLKLR